MRPGELGCLPNPGLHLQPPTPSKIIFWWQVKQALVSGSHVAQALFDPHIVFEQNPSGSLLKPKRHVQVPPMQLSKVVLAAPSTQALLSLGRVHCAQRGSQAWQGPVPILANPGVQSHLPLFKNELA